MDDMITVYENSHYKISHWPRGTSKAVIVFSSGGNLALAQPVSEFKKSITKYNVSYIFFQSKHLDWYNNEHAVESLKELAKISTPYQKVFAMGESLGGSGALLFCQFFPNIYRVLAFSPQYSCLPQFCKWYGPLGAVDGIFPKYTFAEYSNAIARDKAVIIVPSRSWEDDLHTRFFKSEGYNTVRLRSAEHAMARFLKNTYLGNYLDLCLAAFFDTKIDFCEQTFKNILHPFVEDSWMMYRRWIGDITYEYTHYLEKPSEKCISDGKKATQSSICPYSRKNTVEEDAQLAISGPLTSDYSFHTDEEVDPWWQVDLGSIHTIKRIRVFNRTDHSEWAQRLIHFYILASEDGIYWKEIYYRAESEIIGGLFGMPLDKQFSLNARFIRVQLDGYGVLHLSRVEVFGDEISNDLSDEM